MAEKFKEIVIPKEDAVFWMDKNGCWYNEHGKFQHKKIIDYFNGCIKKDKDGFYLAQEMDKYREKVYFPYEETAYFVYEVIKNQEITLVLNTKKKVKLKPRLLFINDDSLYMTIGDDCIKFTEQAMIKISDMLEYEKDKYFIRFKGRRYEIKKEKLIK